MAAPETLRRAGITSRLLMAFQSAGPNGGKGVVVDDFTTSDAAILWTEEPQIDAGRLKSDGGPWMTQLEAEDQTGRYSRPEQPTGIIRAVATPESVEFFLRSNWGPLAAGVFGLKPQINEYATLAWVEDYRAGSTQNLVRIRDVWLHAIRFRAARQDRLVMEADYAGRSPGQLDPSVSVDALNALPGGVVLPASPMTPGDFNKFPNIVGEFRRDPTGANVQIRISELELTLDQNLTSEWVEAGGWDIGKLGKTKVGITFTGNVVAETWDILNDSRVDTKRQFRIIAKAQAPSKTLTIDLFDVSFEIERLGYLPGRAYVEFKATGQAFKTGTDFVTIGLV